MGSVTCVRRTVDNMDAGRGILSSSARLDSHPPEQRPLHEQVSNLNGGVQHSTGQSVARARPATPSAARQMGDGIGVNLDKYTVTALDQRTAAVELLEASVLH
jgi:hypothetical protein